MHDVSQPETNVGNTEKTFMKYTSVILYLEYVLALSVSFNSVVLMVLLFKMKVPPVNSAVKMG